MPVGYSVSYNGSNEIDLNILPPSNLTWVGGDATNPNKWDIFVSANWTGDASTYKDGDFVTFNGSGLGHSNVTLDAGGVAPGSMTVTAGGYAFSGGSIKGATSLVVNLPTPATDVVTMNITNNTYSGGTQILGGTLIVMGDGSLGAASGAVTLGSTNSVGRLKLGADFVSTRPFATTGGVNGGGYINTNGFNASLAPTAAITLGGTFAKFGAGELMIKTGGFSGPANTFDIYVVGGTLTLGDRTSATTDPHLFVTDLKMQLWGGTLEVAAPTAAKAAIAPSIINSYGANSLVFYNTSTSATISPTLAKPLMLSETSLGANDAVFTVDFGGTTGSNRVTFSNLTLNSAATIKTVATATYTSNISFNAAINDNGKPLTFLGGGSATLVTGSGIFLNAASSSVTGTWTLGKSDGTEGVVVSPSNSSAFTTGNITVNPYSSLVMYNGLDGSSYGAPGQTVTINGVGNQLAPTGPLVDSVGAMVVDGLTSTSSTNTATFTTILLSDVSLAADSVVTVTGSRKLNVAGTIFGNGALLKQGTGTLILPNGNSYLGNTSVNSGKLLVTNSSGSATDSGSRLRSSAFAFFGSSSSGSILEVPCPLP